MGLLKGWLHSSSLDRRSANCSGHGTSAWMWEPLSKPALRGRSGGHSLPPALIAPGRRSRPLGGVQVICADFLTGMKPVQWGGAWGREGSRHPWAAAAHAVQALGEWQPLLAPKQPAWHQGTTCSFLTVLTALVGFLPREVACWLLQAPCPSGHRHCMFTTLREPQGGWGPHDGSHRSPKSQRQATGGRHRQTSIPQF